MVSILIERRQKFGGYGQEKGWWQGDARVKSYFTMRVATNANAFAMPCFSNASLRMLQIWMKPVSLHEDGDVKSCCGVVGFYA